MSSYFSEGKREDYIRTNSRYEAGWSDPRECRAGPLVSWRPNYHPSTSPPVRTSIIISTESSSPRSTTPFSHSARTRNMSTSSFAGTAMPSMASSSSSGKWTKNILYTRRYRPPSTVEDGYSGSTCRRLSRVESCRTLDPSSRTL